MPLQLDVPIEEIARCCRDNRIVRLRAFGSVRENKGSHLTGDTSDVDATR